MNNDQIRFLFTKVRELIPTLDHDYLNNLEQDSLANRFGWIDKLRAFLRGLWTANLIDNADLDDIDKILEKNNLL